MPLHVPLRIPVETRISLQDGSSLKREVQNCYGTTRCTSGAFVPPSKYVTSSNKSVCIDGVNCISNDGDERTSHSADNHSTVLLQEKTVSVTSTMITGFSGSSHQGECLSCSVDFFIFHVSIFRAVVLNRSSSFSFSFLLYGYSSFFFLYHG